MKRRNEFSEKQKTEQCQEINCIDSNENICESRGLLVKQDKRIIYNDDWRKFLPNGIAEEYIPFRKTYGFLTIADIVCLESEKFIIYFNYFFEKYENLRRIQFEKQSKYSKENNLPVKEYVCIRAEDYRRPSPMCLEPRSFICLTDKFVCGFKALIVKAEVLYEFEFHNKPKNYLEAIAENVEGRIAFIMELDKLYIDNYKTMEEAQIEREEMWENSQKEYQKAIEEREELLKTIENEYGIVIVGKESRNRDKFKSRNAIIAELLNKIPDNRNQIMKEIYAKVGYDKVWHIIKNKILSDYPIRTTDYRKKRYCLESDIFYEAVVKELSTYIEDGQHS